VFEAQLLDEERYGMVGKVSSVHLEHINHCLRREIIPVVSPLGESRDGRILNINADVATNELVLAIKPFKIVFLTPTGGILDNAGQIIPSINLTTDYDRLINEPWLHSGMRLKLEQINSLLLRLPKSSSVSITRPGMLAKELFTYRGSGTLVRVGEKVEKHVNWDTVDCERLRELLENSFGRGLVADYFEKTPLEALYVAQNYKAAAIIVADGAIARLDKFAVTEKAQGEGLASAVWAQVRAGHDCMYWRASPDNPVNEFYFEQADGCVKGDSWNVYWYGLAGFEQIQSCVEGALRAAVTLD
jgi:acetylglutamate kinase